MKRKKIKAYDFTRIYINLEKIVTKRLKQWKHGNASINCHIEFLEDSLGCCIFKSHEIALHLDQIEFESCFVGIDFYKLVCLTICHETMELLCNDIIGGNDSSWHYYSGMLRTEGYGC